MVLIDITNYVILVRNMGLGWARDNEIPRSDDTLILWYIKLSTGRK